MKIVQSFWSKSIFQLGDDPRYVDKPGNIGSLDWIDRSYFFYSWALSALQLTRQGRQVVLVTDSVGKKLLVDLIGLPYQEVTLRLNDLSHIPPDFWCLAKLLAYQEILEPFLHVDYDIFISSHLVDAMERHGLAALHKEEDPLNEQIATKIESTVDNCVGFGVSAQKGKSINTGIIGGENWRLLSEFATMSSTCLLANQQNLLRLMDVMHPKYINRFFDQMLMHNFTVARHLDWHFAMKNINARKDGLGAVYDFPTRTSCLHINHEYRRNSRICWQLKQMLQTEFPLYFDRINKLLMAGEL
ncbi:MAG: DUF6734 family protein [Bacteroidota bacterium]